jgi:hypothetical protein
MTRAISLFPALERYLANLAQFKPPAERQPELSRLAHFTAQQVRTQGQAALVFICTHNSRRSHFGQVWAQTLADHHGLIGVTAYSGGTEATACHPHTVAALRRAGFEVDPLDQQANPRYRIRYGEGHPGLEAWSKHYSHPTNPQQGFAAIMTCDSAHEACPVVLGAAARFPILYQDPKAYDGTPQEQAAYDERCQQIAVEMNWLMKKMKAKHEKDEHR